jgi:hypothetical protein
MIVGGVELHRGAEGLIDDNAHTGHDQAATLLHAELEYLTLRMTKCSKHGFERSHGYVLTRSSPGCTCILPISLIHCEVWTCCLQPVP